MGAIDCVTHDGAVSHFAQRLSVLSRGGVGQTTARAKCWGPSATAAKCAAFGRDDEVQRGVGLTVKTNKDSYGDSGCARMTTLEKQGGYTAFACLRKLLG